MTNNTQSNANEQPLISVVMPVCNTPKEYLKDAIDSILVQTHTNFEFIIIDDGSSVNIPDEVINSYNDERIVYLKNETNSGVSKTLNRGIELAKGEYIARMDSDDISMPERFEKQIEFFNTNPEISILGGWIEKFPKKKIIKNDTKVTILSMLHRCQLAHPTVMFRATVFEDKNLRYNPEFDKVEDYELWSRCIQSVKIANLPEVLLKYREHSNNESKIHRKKQKEWSYKIQQNILNYLTDDVKLQENIMKLVCSTAIKESNFIEKLFFIKNIVPYKIINILGFQIYIKKENRG